MSEEVKKNEAPDTTPETKFVRYDDYWLLKARTLIDGAVETFTKRLTALNNFLNYLAAGSFLGTVTYTTYTQSTHLEVYALAVIPLIFIAIAKFFVGVKGSEPAMSDTNMRSPNEINEDYAELLKILSKQVKKAAEWVAVATGFTLVCLPLAVYFHNINTEVNYPESYVDIKSDGTTVFVNGLLPKAENVSVILYGKDSKKKKIDPYTTTILKEDNGNISAVYSIKDLGITLDSVQLQYGKDKKLHSYSYSIVKGAASASPARAQEKPKKDPKAEEKKKDSTAAKKPDK